MALSIQSASCSEHSVGGKTADQVFPDHRVAALAKAACNGDKVAIADALSNGAVVDGKGLESVTPLIWAVDCKNNEGIEALLSAGADPNYKMQDGISATFASAGITSSKPLELLLRYHGNPNSDCGDASTATALWSAFELGFHGDGWDNYYALLNAGADINKADSAGKTIATAEAALGAYSKVQELLERGYTHNLSDLLATVEVRKIDASAFPEIAKAQARVIEVLKARLKSHS